MKKTLALLVLASTVLAACGGAATATESSTIETVSPHQAASLLEDGPADLVVLDIRTPEEVAAGKIEGASSIDFYQPDFAAQLDGLDKDVPYLVYCRSGNRTSEAVGIMRDLGFREVYELDGGILNWYESGFPVSES